MKFNKSITGRDAYYVCYESCPLCDGTNLVDTRIVRYH